MELLKLYYLIFVVLAIVGLAIWLYASSQKAKPCTFSEEEVKKPRRAYNLFDNSPLQKGYEWKVLSVNELVEIITSASMIIARGEGSSFETAMEEYADRCEQLSIWIKRNKDHPIYIDFDMNYLIEKPLEVSRIIRGAYL